MPGSEIRGLGIVHLGSAFAVPIDPRSGPDCNAPPPGCSVHRWLFRTAASPRPIARRQRPGCRLSRPTPPRGLLPPGAFKAVYLTLSCTATGADEDETAYEASDFPTARWHERSPFHTCLKGAIFSFATLYLPFAPPYKGGEKRRASSPQPSPLFPINAGNGRGRFIYPTQTSTLSPLRKKMSCARTGPWPKADSAARR